jgi:hypothetical protein
MGGIGSGRWRRRRERKPAVDDCLTLPLSGFRGRLYPGSSGEVTWALAGTIRSAVGFTVIRADGEMTLNLRYSMTGRQHHDLAIPLTQTPANLSGSRYWFACPNCSTRAMKLYLPPAANQFACRKCHSLSYRSAQESHSISRLLMRIGYSRDRARDEERIMRRLMRR